MLLVAMLLLILIWQMMRRISSLLYVSFLIKSTICTTQNYKGFSSSASFSFQNWTQNKYKKKHRLYHSVYLHLDVILCFKIKAKFTYYYVLNYNRKWAQNRVGRRQMGETIHLYINHRTSTQVHLLTCIIKNLKCFTSIVHARSQSCMEETTGRWVLHHDHFTDLCAAMKYLWLRFNSLKALSHPHKNDENKPQNRRQQCIV